MQNRLLNYCFFIVLALSFSNCANRGNITGGEKDTTPPRIIKSTPENYTTNFKGKDIKIYFDEYIKVKDINKQLIISPPMTIAPEVTPLGSASKYIKIKIFDTLQPNTTYTFNFGNSISDNNESNPFKLYKYVFSTGNSIDSLKVKGKVMDALKRKAESFVSVNLYEVDANYSDSIIYNNKPKYVTNTLDSTTNFTLENIKAGTYKLIALKDNNGNNKFDSKSDKIGFYEDFITVTSDSSAFYKLNLFKEKIDFKLRKPRQLSGEKIVFGFEGEDYKKVKIEPLSKPHPKFRSRLIKDPKTDSLYYYYNPKVKSGAITFKVKHEKEIDTFTVKITDKKRDTLVISPKQRNKIGVLENLTIAVNTPIRRHNKKNIIILDKDSISIPFKSKIDKLHNLINFEFDKKEDNHYKVTLLPKAIIDFFGKTNDTLSFTLKTEKASNTGNVRLNIKKGTYPLIVQLVDNKDIIRHQAYLKKAKPLDFFMVAPGKYFVRAIFDSNKNKKYDTGNFLKSKQPERVSYSERAIEVRTGWDLIEDFTLN